MTTHASILVLALVVGALAGSLMMATGTPVVAGSAGLVSAAGGPPSDSHGACVVSAVRAAQNGDLGSGIGWLVRSMARRC